MERSNIRTITLASLLVINLAVVGFSLSDTNEAIIAQRFVEFTTFSLLTALALILSVPLSRGELSIAHAMGMIAFLSLEAMAAPPMTIAICIGGIIAAIALNKLPLHPASKHLRTTWQDGIFITSQVTLPFFVASRMYAGFFNAPQPISTQLGINDWQSLVPLLLFAFIYVALYFAIFVLQYETQSHESHRLLAENSTSLGIILVLPIPFAIVAANVAVRDTSPIYFVVTLVGMVLIILGLFALNRTQQRMRRTLSEMSAISSASQALRSDLSVDGLVQTTSKQVTKLLNIDNFTLALCDAGAANLRYPLIIRHGEALADTSHKPDDHALIEHVIQSRRSLLLEQDVKLKVTELGLQPPRQPIQSWLGIPLLKTGETVMGAIVVQSFDERQFDERSLRLLDIIASSASIALENANLYEQKSSRAEQLATLNQVTTLLTGTLAPNEVLDTIVSSASTISEANAISIFLVTHERNKPELKLVRDAGLSDKFSTNPIMPISTEEMMYNTDKFVKPDVVVIDNTQEHNLALAKSRQRLREENIGALIELPLNINGRNLGVLGLYFTQTQQFQEEQIDLIQAFGTQAAQAIDNAHTFTSTDEALEQRVEQLYALAAMGRLLNATMETERIYQIVLTYCTDATKAPHGMLVIKQAHGKLMIPAHKGYPQDTVSDPSILMQGLTGRVLQTGQPLRIADTRLETGYLPLLPTSRSMLIIPIMKRRDVLGVVVLEHHNPGHFSESDTHFVAQIANQAVIAVDNTQLFQRVREGRDNLQTIINAMEDGMILVDARGIVSLANPRVDTIGLSADAILQQPIEALLQDESLNFARHLGFSNGAVLHRMIEDIGKDDATWPTYPAADYEINTPQYGLQFIQRQVIPVRVEEQEVIGVLLVFYNKTEERELARQQESFSQMIVHDLRSPLTAVTTSLRLLQELVPDDSDFRPIVEKTTDASRRAIRKVLNRVDSLLDISKMESGTMSLEREPADLITMVDSVRNELKPLANELEVTLDNQVSPDLPPLDVDADKIERMIMNLMDNALKYSPANSTVTMRAVMQDTNFVRLEVVDNGPGVPDEYKTRLFERFVQVEGRQIVRRGVGLGLAFCKLVSQAHGGEIWVDDNPEGGSIFNATLPIAKLPELVE